MSAALTQRMNFYERILREGKFCAGTQAVAFLLLYKFYNGKTGRCDPGQKAIAEAAAITKRHVKRATDELRDAGWFDVRVGAGTNSKFGSTTAYIPRFDRVTSSSAAGDDESVREGVTSSSAKPVIEPIRGADAPSGTSEASPWDFGLSILTDAGVSQKQARQLIGKWRRQLAHDDARLMSIFLSAKNRSVVDPVAYVQAGVNSCAGAGTGARELSAAEKRGFLEQWGLTRAAPAEVDAKVRAEGLADRWHRGAA
jgi:hypothetical protein